MMLDLIPSFGMTYRPERSRFSRFFDDWYRPALVLEEGDWMPPADISETDDAFILTADLPGIDMKEVEITYMDGVLTFKGERKGESGEGMEKTCSERYSGPFHRSFHIPKGVDGDKIDATYKDGVLRIFIPKSKESRMRKIEVH